jgi:predicted DNA-binding transcriptional regulator AlpA
MLRIALALYLLFIPFAGKPPSPPIRAGIGTGEHTGTQEQLTALKAAWFYDWGANNGWDRNGYNTEYVPMAFGAYNTGWEAREVEQWLAGHPQSYVLILNEPNIPYQANLTCEQAGQDIGRYANDILADYPQARLIVGGLFVADYEAHGVQAALAYAQCMRENMPVGVEAKLAGYHWHYYPFYAPITAEKLEAAATELCEWTPGECWLTEVGLLAGAAGDSDAEQYMRDAIAWLKGTAIVDRHAWFAGQCEYSCPAALYLWDGGGELTEWGMIYANP